MRRLIPLVIAILTTAPASALSRNECYAAARGMIVGLLHGHVDGIGPHVADSPEVWFEWLATEFPGPEPYREFSVVFEERRRDGCQARIRVQKEGGRKFAILADFDERRRLTKLQSVRELFEAARLEMLEVVAEIAEVPRLGAGRVDDSSALPLLKRLARISDKTQADTAKFVGILEYDEGNVIRKVPPTEPR